MVEPGKNPNRGLSPMAAGRANRCMKFPAIGYIGSVGNCRASAATESRRKSPEISIGTYAEGATADRTSGVLADEPEPNSTTAWPGPSALQYLLHVP